MVHLSTSTIKEGLERVDNDGLLHVLSVSHMSAVSRTLADYIKRPKAYTEIPTLVSGNPIQSTDPLKDVLEALAVEINAVDQAKGTEQPLAATYVFKQNLPKSVGKSRLSRKRTTRRFLRGLLSPCRT